MKKMNAKGFSAVEGLLLLVIVGLIAGIGYYVWSQNKSKSTADNTADISAKVVTKQQAKNVEFIPTDVSEGWVVDIQDANRVDLKNKDKDCFASVISAYDAEQGFAGRGDEDNQTIEAIRGKGYTVTELAKATLDLPTNNGIKSVQSLEIDITGNNNPMSQSYGHIATDKRYTNIQLSCLKRSDLPNAREALKTIKVNF